MEAVQKFSSFSDLKKAEKTVSTPIDSQEIKHFLALMREGKVAVEIKNK